jgi:hypothetical protein
MTQVRNTPAPGALLRAELQVLWIRGRRSILTYLVLLYGILLLLALSTRAQMRSAPGSLTDTFRLVDPGALLLPAVLGLLWAVWSWRSEPPSARGYFYGAPVDRAVHTLARTAAGWLGLMACVAAYALAVIVYVLATHGVEALARGPFWGWPALFAAATVTYLLSTPFGVLTETPDRWIFLTALLFLFAVPLILYLTEAQWLLERVAAVRSHLLTAVLGSSPRSPVPDPGEFFAAAAVWIAVGAAATVASAKRYIETR